MRALVWYGPRSMQLVEISDPTPEPAEVLIKVDAAGICGSDVSGFMGESELRKPPLIMGHEFAGRVAQAPQGSQLALGQRVVVNPLISCGVCEMCRKGTDNLCLERLLIGAHRPGGFAELVTVPERNCYHLPPTISASLGATIEPLACAVRAVEIARVSLSDKVLILGAGSIGLLTLAVARRTGASVVVVADVIQARLRTAIAWGATHVVDGRENALAALHQVTGSSAIDVAIDAVGRTSTRRTAVQAVRRGGRVVLVGLHESESSLPANDLVRGEITVRGSFGYTRETFKQAIELVDDGLVPSGGWFEERPLASGPECFSELVTGQVAVSKIVLQP